MQRFVHSRRSGCSGRRKKLMGTANFRNCTVYIQKVEETNCWNEITEDELNYYKCGIANIDTSVNSVVWISFFTCILVLLINADKTGDIVSNLGYYLYFYVVFLAFWAIIKRFKFQSDHCIYVTKNYKEVKSFYNKIKFTFITSIILEFIICLDACGNKILRDIFS